jgi:hypothetical protein
MDIKETVELNVHMQLMCSYKYSTKPKRPQKEENFLKHEQLLRSPEQLSNIELMCFLISFMNAR